MKPSICTALFAACFLMVTAQAVHAEPREKLDFEVSLLDGSSFSASDKRGQWLVVNFWATWCTPCIKEIPDLSALHDGNEDISVIGLAWEDIDEADIQRFLEVNPASYPISIIDVYDPPPTLTAPRGLPLTLILDPQGGVAERFLGPVTRDSLERAIAALRD